MTPAERDGALSMQIPASNGGRTTLIWPPISANSRNRRKKEHIAVHGGPRLARSGPRRRARRSAVPLPNRVGAQQVGRTARHCRSTLAIRRLTRRLHSGDADGAPRHPRAGDRGVAVAPSRRLDQAFSSSAQQDATDDKSMSSRFLKLANPQSSTAQVHVRRTQATG